MASTSNSSLNSGKPERSFSFKRLKGALRRPSLNSKLSASTGPEGFSSDSKGVDSDSGSISSQQPISPPNTPPPTQQTHRRGRASTDLGRRPEPKRSASVARSEASIDADPSSSSKRSWSIKKVKGALKRTASRLSVSSQNDKKHPDDDDEGSIPDVPPLPASDQANEEPLAVSEPLDAPAAAAAEVDPVSREAVAGVSEPEALVIPAPARLELGSPQMSSSSEWEQVEVEESTPAPVIEALKVNEVPSVTVQTVEDKVAPVAPEPLKQLLHIQEMVRSEIAELSPIVESPLREERETFGIQIVPNPVEDNEPQPTTHEVLESETITRPQYPSVNTSAPILATPSTTEEIATTPHLDAIELGKSLSADAHDKNADSADSKPSTKPKGEAELVLPTSTSPNGQVVAEAPEAAAPPLTAVGILVGTVNSAVEIVATTAWLLGACVVVGLGLVVGQARSYRRAHLGSGVIQPARRWHVNDWRFW